MAFFAGGKLIDLIATRMTKSNGGKREPEFRLPAIVIPAFLGPMGILIFGLCIVHKTHWIGPAFGYGMQGFGLTAVANVAITFAVDAYQPVGILSFAIYTHRITDNIFAARWRSARRCLRNPKYDRNHSFAVHCQLARS